MPFTGNFWVRFARCVHVVLICPLEVKMKMLQTQQEQQIGEELGLASLIGFDF